MDESILDTIKDLVGVSSEDNAFDGEIITAINTAFFTLNQIGVGEGSPFNITGNSEVWRDFIGDIDSLSMIKNYVGLRVRLLFDPPATQTLMTAIRDQITEYEWRLNVEADYSWEAV